MDRQLFETVTDKEWLSDEELDEKRQEMTGEGLEALGYEWEDMLRFSYQMDEFDVLKFVGELGAATTIIILTFDEEDIDEPDKEGQELLESMQRQGGEVGQIARYIELDDSLDLEAAGRSESAEDTVVLQIWT